ncbi:MAG: hypothetical protein H0T46_17485 [Deltaproteobacteria bacterium]|nr:hypothetical protein [Deltaproteobacteria bacterium]
MPVYDRVLGSHLDLEGVAPAAHDEIQRRFFAAIANDADVSVQDRLDRFTELARVSGVRLAVACEGEELDRYLVIGNDGSVRIVVLRDSRAADQLEPARGSIHPEVAVVGDANAIVHRLEQAGALDPIYDLGNGAITLPFRWQSREELIRALVEVAPLLATSAPFLVEIDDRRFEISVAHGRLCCEPLHLVAPEDGAGFGEAFCELARMPLPSPADRVELVLRTRPPVSTMAMPPMRDPGRPYTTGTADQRRQSIAAAVAAKTKDLARLIAALQDPANADPRYDQVRRDLYRYLAAHDTREIAGLFLWALQEESEPMIETITLLAWRQSALLAALPDLAEAAEARDDQRLASRMRAALDEAQA